MTLGQTNVPLTETEERTQVRNLGLKLFLPPGGAIRSDQYRALVRDMQKLFFIFSFLFKKAFACTLPLDRGF